MSRILKIAFGAAVALLLIAGVALAILPGIIERGQNKTAAHPPYEISRQAAALHATLRLADLHADTLLWKRDLLRRSNRGHVDLPRLEESNTALQVFSAVTKSPSGLNYEENSAGSDDLNLLVRVQRWPIRTWNSLLQRALFQAEKLRRFEQNSDGRLRVVTSAETLQAALDEGAIAALLATEGAHPLEGDIANLDKLWEAGYRIIGLQHFFDNALGGSLHGVSNKGLTPFGKEVVRELEARGAIIDLAHSSEAVVEDVLAITDGPLMISHTGMKGQCNTPRNISDDLMVRIAGRGGLIGIGYWDAAVCDISPAGIAAALRYAVDRLGIDHVAYGADYDGAVTVAVDAGERVALTDAMLDAGFTEEEIRKISGENAVRFLRENLP